MSASYFLSICVILTVIRIIFLIRKREQRPFIDYNQIVHVVETCGTTIKVTYRGSIWSAIMKSQNNLDCIPLVGDSLKILNIINNVLILDVLER